MTLTIIFAFLTIAGIQTRKQNIKLISRIQSGVDVKWNRKTKTRTEDDALTLHSVSAEYYLAITSDKLHAMTGVDSVFAESAKFSSANKI